MTPTEAEWCVRVHRAMDLVLADLGRPRDLAEVARAVHASPFHFHRVFAHLTGETLHTFQKRVRLERALYAMAHAPRRRLTDIALDCGFSSPSSFSRAFREQYGASPRQFDLLAWRQARRAELVEHQHSLVRLPSGANPDGLTVAIRELPARHLAYLRVTDPYRPGRITKATERLLTWADAHGLADGRWYGWMWEDPELVPLARCRYDVAVEVPPGTRPAAPVGMTTLPPMRVATLALAGDIACEQRALDWLYGTWLPRSGHEPAPLPCMEVWAGRPFAHGMEHFELELHLPLEHA